MRDCIVLCVLHKEYSKEKKRTVGYDLEFLTKPSSFCCILSKLFLLKTVHIHKKRKRRRGTRVCFLYNICQEGRADSLFMFPSHLTQNVKRLNPNPVLVFYFFQNGKPVCILLSSGFLRFSKQKAVDKAHLKRYRI